MVLGVFTDRYSRTQIGEMLQGTLYDLSALNALCKQARWNVVGPAFYSIHLSLEQLGALIEEQCEEVASALNCIGLPAIVQRSNIDLNSEILPIPEGFLMDRQVVDLVRERFQVFHTLSKGRQIQLREHDVLSADMLRRISSRLEKQLRTVAASHLAA